MARQGYLLEARELVFSLNLLDENVNWEVFTKSAWIRVTNAMMELAKDPKYLYGSATKISIRHCEACLTWYHLRCAGLAVAPKKIVEFVIVLMRKKVTTER